MLAFSLLQAPSSTSAIIDTTGNLDIFRLYTLTLSHLQRDASLLRSSTLHSPPVIEDVATEVLDRVKIMRAFDLVGVMEAIDEIGEEFEGRGTSEKGREDTAEQSETDLKARAAELMPSKRTFIPDSEAEDEDDEMLLDNEVAYGISLGGSNATPPEQKVQARVAAERDSHEPPHAAPDEPQPKASEKTSRDEHTVMQKSTITFILIDNLPQVVTHLQKKGYIQGLHCRVLDHPQYIDDVLANATTSSVLTRLSRLTYTHGLYTLLFNPCTPPLREAPSTIRSSHQQAPSPCSLFASNRATPALLNLLGPYLDVHLLVSRLPRRKKDAQFFYADGGGDGVMGKKKRGVEMVGVMEVLSDRWGDRTGAWGTFSQDENGLKGI